MGFFEKLGRAIGEFRSSLENPATPLSYPAEWLLDIFNGGRTDAGIRVSELTSLQVSTVYACVDLISGGLAALDLNVYERLIPRGKRLAYEQDLHWLLHDQPNEEMTSFTFLQTLQCHCLLWANGYAEIQRDNANRPVALWPRNPNATRPRRLLEDRVIDGELVKTGSIVFVTTDGASIENPTESPERFILAENMLHVPGLSLDGRIGKSTIELSRQVVGLALAAEKFGGKFFANGIRPTGVFEVPQDMSPQAVENFKRSVQEAYGGENMTRPMVSEPGIKWQQSTITPNEAQFLETRKHQREEIAAIFHVPARMVGDSGKVNRASSEQEAIEFVQYTLRPWIKKWQQELKRKLFPQLGRTANKFYPSFYYQDLLLPDAESRSKMIALIRQWGVGNADDIREEYLDWNPIGGVAGTAYWAPVNMQNAENLIAGAIPASGEPGETPDPEGKDRTEDDRSVQFVIRAYSRVFSDAFERISGKQKPDLRHIQLAFLPVLYSIADAHYAANTLGFQADERSSDGLDRFLADYVAAMHKRSSEWAEAQDRGSVCRQELLRAIRAVKTAVYREIAIAKAKQESSPELIPAA